MEYDYSEPVYTMGIVAKALKVCPETLRIWERRGLIKPKRLGKDRFYSKFDLDLLSRIKDLLQNKRINIEGVKSILQNYHCWEIKRCLPEKRNACPVYSRLGYPPQGRKNNL